MIKDQNQSDCPSRPKLVYCHCAYANIIKRDVKLDVLKRLSESGAEVEMVADLCEMSANGHSRLKILAKAAGEEGLVIAACYPRAVKWLFHAANASLPESGVTMLNMREQPAEQLVDCMINGTPIEEHAS